MIAWETLLQILVKLLTLSVQVQQRRHISAALALASAVLLAAGSAESLSYGAEMETLVRDGVTIQYAAYRKDLAEKCVKMVAETRAKMIEQLELPPPEAFSVKLFDTSSEYDQFIAGRVHPHSLGVTFPYARLVAINTSAATLPTLEDIAATVRHELLHLGIARLCEQTGQAVPLWFNEGLAVRFSGQNLLRLRRILPQAAATGTLYSLAQLSEEFPTRLTDLSLAYEEAESAVAYLARRQGGGVFRGLFGRLRRGESFEQALTALTGENPADLEEGWRASLGKGWKSWFTLISSLSLFSLLAAFLVAAYLVGLRRARRTLRQWAEEEGEPMERTRKGPPANENAGPR